MMKRCTLGMLILLFLSSSLFSQTQVEFNNPGSPCAKNVTTPCASPNNQTRFYVVTQTPDAPNPAQPNILPRFKAFWIPGDGNYWDFPDTDTDQESLTPAQPYNYAKGGTYTVSVYLTGKYTDHHPPPGAGRQIDVGPQPAARPGSANPYTPTPFRKRTGSGDYDFFPIHDIRKDYLTPFILSYPATLDNTWGYLFYNGHPSGGAWAERPLKYQKSKGEVANYFNGDTAKIKSYPTLNLTGDAGIDGIFYKPEFAALQSRFNDFVFFPLETASAANMSPGFTQKRYFPVFWADKNVAIGERDSMVAFCYIVTSSKPASEEQQNRINAVLHGMDLNLSAAVPINFGTGEKNEQLDKLAQTGQFQGPGVAAQYIQGIYTGSVKYVAAHDPNQLMVKNVVAQADGKYLVTFELTMCNKGGGRTEKQFIDLFDRFGRFHDFKYQNNPVPAIANHIKLESDLRIEGIPDTGYAMMCKSLEFTAVTDCDGIRSLWAGNTVRALQVCVKFKEAFDTECGDNLPIDSCWFKIDGKCACMEKTPTCGGDGWLLVFVLLFVFVLLVWKYYADKELKL